MNDVLKQRLVGALVIIVLGAIFWPVIFVAPELEPLDRGSQVPSLPALELRELPAPKPLVGLPEANYAEENAAASPSTRAERPAANTVTADAAEKASPALDEAGIPLAWTLQVVTVGSRDKAEQLSARLIGMGYKAYIKSLRRDSKTLYRIYVGPKFAREDMLEAKEVIDKELRVTSLVTRYLP